MPLKVGPVMVLTENGQEEIFYKQVPVGARLRVFGTMPAGRAPGVRTDDREAQIAAAIETSPDVMIPARATNYRRWMNFPWAVVERGGQPKAADWTDADAARLRALVDRAHAMGLWIRFYTLNGHAPDAGQGWSAGYNFGSLDAVRPRWKAAIDAGVDFIATDQYELLGEALKQTQR
jgi:glycerophosphoryl diester phosphodiesterase